MFDLYCAIKAVTQYIVHLYMTKNDKKSHLFYDF